MQLLPWIKDNDIHFSLHHCGQNIQILTSLRIPGISKKFLHFDENNFLCRLICPSNGSTDSRYLRRHYLFLSLEIGNQNQPNSNNTIFRAKKKIIKKKRIRMHDSNFLTFDQFHKNVKEEKQKHNKAKGLCLFVFLSFWIK